MNLELASPMPLVLFQEQLGEGQVVYAADALGPTVLWAVVGPLGAVTLAATVTDDGRVSRLSLTGGQPSGRDY
jgi:hypothetical protein